MKSEKAVAMGIVFALTVLMLVILIGTASAALPIASVMGTVEQKTDTKLEIHTEWKSGDFGGQGWDHFESTLEVPFEFSDPEIVDVIWDEISVGDYVEVSGFHCWGEEQVCLTNCLYIAKVKSSGDRLAEKVITDIYGDPALGGWGWGDPFEHDPPLLGNFNIEYDNKPDCPDCPPGCICEAKYTNIKIRKDGNVLDTFSLYPSQNYVYEGEGHRFDVTFFSGATQCCLGGQVPSNFVIHIEEFSVIESWPMFRHDPMHSGFSESAVFESLKLFWAFNTGNRVHSSPAIYDGKVFVGSEDHKVYCLDEDTGKETWSFETGNVVTSSPAVADGKVFIGSHDHKVYCLDAKTGSLIWEYLTPNIVISSPSVVNGKVLVGSYASRLYVLDEDDGSLLGYFYASGDNFFSSPAVADNKVFIGSFRGASDAEGNVYALDLAENGKLSLIWNYPSAGIYSSPSVSNDKVIVGSSDRRIYCLNAQNGAVIWSFETGDKVPSSPAVADGVVFIGSDDHNVYALDLNNGNKIWSFETGSFVSSSPAVANGKVFVGSYDGKLYVLDEGNGEVISSYFFGAPVFSSPAVADKMVFVGSDNHKVYVFKLEPGLPEDIRITNDPADSINPKIAVDSNNTVHIVWEDSRNGNYYDICYTKLDNKGNTLIDDKRLTHDATYSSQPAIAIDSNKNVHITWVDTNDWIYYTKLDNDGNILVDNKKLTVLIGYGYDDVYVLGYPRIAIDSNDNIHVVWDDGRNPKSELYYMKLDNNGNKLVSDKRLTYDSELSWHQDIVIDSDDNVHIIWVDYRYGIKEIYYTKLDNNGNILMDDKKLSKDSTEPWGLTADIDSDDNIHITWSDYKDGKPGIYYSKLDKKGNILVNVKKITSPKLIYYQSIAVDSNNDIHITWWDSYSHELHGNDEIYYIKLDNNGNTLIDDTRLTNDPAYSAFPDIAIDSNNKVHITWQDDRDGNWEIYYKSTAIGGALSDLTLSPEDISFSNPNPTVGESVTITATIHNIGNADARNVIVQFFDGNPDNGGTQIGSDQTVNSIGAGGTGIAQVDWTAISGGHEIYVIIDHGKVIIESNEGNNIASNTIVVGISAPEGLGVWIDNTAIVDMSKLVDMGTKLVFISGGDINYDGSLSNTDKIDYSFVDECYLNNIQVHLWLGYWKYKDWDDDSDGQIDEDQIDGIDNDGDGQIDEDPAGLSEINWLKQDIEGKLVRERLENEISTKIVDIYSDKIAGIHFNIEGFNEPSQDIKENVANSYNTFLSKLKTESGKTISITPEPFIKWNVQNNPIDEADFFVAMLYWAAAYGSNSYQDICNDFSQDKYSWLKSEVEVYASKAETFNKNFYVFVGTFGVWVDELNDDKNIIDEDHGPREELKSKYYGIGEVFNSASESEVANSEFVKGHSPGLTDVIYDYLDTAGVLLYRFDDKKTLVWKTPQGIIKGVKKIEDNGGNKYRGPFVFLYDSTQEPEWNAIEGYETHPIPKVSLEEISNNGGIISMRISLTNQQNIEDTQRDEWANGVHIHLENAEFVSVDVGDFDEDYAFNDEAEEIDIVGSNIIELTETYMQAEESVSSGEIKIQVTGGSPVIYYRGWMRDKDDMVESHHLDHTGEQVNYVARDPSDYTDDRFDGTSDFLKYKCYTESESIVPEHWFDNPWFDYPGFVFDTGPIIDPPEYFKEAPGKKEGIDWAWGIRGATWKFEKEGLFSMHEVQFDCKEMEENNYDVHMRGIDNTKEKKEYAVVSLLQGNAWNMYPEWYIPKPLTIDDNEIYIDTWLMRGDADESDDIHNDFDREMYAVDLWFVESDTDPHTLTKDDRCKKCRDKSRKKLVLDLIFHVGPNDEYGMAFPTRKKGEGAIFHYEPSVVGNNPESGLPSGEWKHFQKIDVNTHLQKALELTQKPEEWTWNTDGLTPKDVTFDPHKMMLCQAEMIIELRDADGELTVGGFDLYYYPISSKELIITAFCPMDLSMIDPEGFIINKQLNEIPSATYIEADINGDGDPDDIITIPDRKIGDYKITVIPELDAEPTDTYTLEVLTWGTTTVLAKNVPVSEIPTEPYIFKSDLNQPPSASFTYSPKNPAVSQSITFDASSSYDPDGYITNYKWDFGDGNITNTKEEIITHSYSLAGEYMVKLTVTDNSRLTNSTTKGIKMIFFPCLHEEDFDIDCNACHRANQSTQFPCLSEEDFGIDCNACHRANMGP